MNRKNRICQLCDYVLSQDHEREDLIDRLSRENDITRKELRIMAQNSIWYSAMSLMYGKREANKEVTELIKEVLE